MDTLLEHTILLTVSLLILCRFCSVCVRYYYFFTASTLVVVVVVVLDIKMRVNGFFFILIYFQLDFIFSRQCATQHNTKQNNNKTSSHSLETEFNIFLFLAIIYSCVHLCSPLYFKFSFIRIQFHFLVVVMLKTGIIAFDARSAISFSLLPYTNTICEIV